jgi:hypothetical protein
LRPRADPSMNAQDIVGVLGAIVWAVWALAV